MSHDPTIKFSWDQGSFCGATDCLILDFVWPSPWVSKPEWFSDLHLHLIEKASVAPDLTPK